MERKMIDTKEVAKKVLKAFPGLKDAPSTSPAGKIYAQLQKTLVVESRRMNVEKPLRRAAKSDRRR
jgi:hypothetical protein